MSLGQRAWQGDGGIEDDDDNDDTSQVVDAMRSDPKVDMTPVLQLLKEREGSRLSK